MNCNLWGILHREGKVINVIKVKTLITFKKLKVITFKKTIIKMEKQESDLINFVLQSDSNNHNLKHIIDEIEKLPYYPSQHLREVIWENTLRSVIKNLICPRKP